MKYLLAFFGEEGGWDDVSPEEMKEGMRLWGAYGQELVDAGAFIAGEGLQPSATATTVEALRRRANRHRRARSRRRRSSSAAST